VQIQVNTDNNIEGRDELAGQIEAEVNATLSRFSDQITRVEIHLSDENAGKSGSADKRCLMEARPAGRQPIAVSHEGATLEEAYSGAARKLRSSLESTLARASDHKGVASIRYDEPPLGQEADQKRPRSKVPANPPGPGAKDRPGFDLGGAVTDATAGSGLGLGDDASENSGDRRLPGRRPRNKLGLPRFGGAVVNDK